MQCNDTDYDKFNAEGAIKFMNFTDWMGGIN